MNSTRYNEIQNISEDKAFLFFSIIAFCSFPLMATLSLRIKVGLLEIPIFAISLLILSFIAFLKVCVGHAELDFHFSKKQRYFIIFLFLFIVLHLMNTTRSLKFDKAFSWDIKLIVCFSVFLLISILFTEMKVITVMLDTIIISSSILILVYIYRYLIVFRSSYLSIEWGYASQVGKNQIGLYLAVATPIALWKYFDKRVLSVWIIPAFIHIYGSFYTMSRGTWVSLVLSFMFILLLFSLNGQPSRKGLIITIAKRSAVIFAIIILLGLAINLSMVKAEASRRFLSLRELRDIEGTSIEDRKTYISQSIEKFLENPVLGIGTFNFFFKTGMDSHNDYLRVLSEQGILGIVIFAGLIGIVISSIHNIDKRRWETIALIHSCIAILFYFLFINTYANVIIYVIFALLMSLERAISKESSK